ncbi:unnamed protein product [Chrysoparadoxa australica]
MNQDIAALAFPALVSLAIDPLMSLVDTFYVGQTGAEGLAALGLNAFIFSFSFYLFNFFATVPTPLVASSLAAGDQEAANRILGQLITLALGIGSLLMVVLEVGSSEFLSVMGANADTMGPAKAYLTTRALAAPAVLLISVGNGAFRGMLDTKTPLLLAIAANLINFILDPVLIFGLDLGAQGAAAATVTAEWFAALTFLALLRGKGISARFEAPVWEQVSPLVVASSAVFLRTVSLQAVLTTASAFAARTGEASIAAHQLASQLWLLLSFVMDALAVASQGLVADSLGKQDLSRARQVGLRTLLMGLGCGIVLLGGFTLLGADFPRLFTSDAAVLSATAPLITLVGLMQPLNAYVFVGDGVLQGSLDFVYEACCMAGSAGLAGLWIVNQGHDLAHVWLGLLLLQSMRAVTFSYRFFLDPTAPLATNKAADDS